MNTATTLTEPQRQALLAIRANEGRGKPGLNRAKRRNAGVHNNTIDALFRRSLIGVRVRGSHVYLHLSQDGRKAVGLAN